MSRVPSIRYLSRVGVLAAVYAVLTALPPLSSLSYGPVQVRVSEALTVLPYVAPWAMWGLYLGCILGNLASPFLAWDVTIGALATLVAAYATRKMPRDYLAPLPPVIVNALVVSAYVAPLSGVPYWLTAVYIALGETVASFGIGYPLLLIIEKNPKLKEFISGSS
ncbi:MAG: QueT transporter family protein [Firmicutes bacterium]|nr:QueT transporter family protein [Candidatus Fermentithermobacillaceae bacterium]